MAKDKELGDKSLKGQWPGGTDVAAGVNEAVKHLHKGGKAASATTTVFTDADISDARPGGSPPKLK